MRRVFIVGEQRSGSNLLRLMLDQIPGLACPHPPHILQRMYPLLDRYGELSDDGSFLRLAKDVVELIRRNPVEWEGFEATGEVIAGRCRKRSLLSVYEQAMDEYALGCGSDLGWVCKSMQNIRWFREMEEHFQDPLYLYLYRDPRDVAVSFRKAVVGNKHPFLVAQKWAALQKLCLNARSEVPSRFLSISYESLIAEPRAAAMRICSFLGVAYTDLMLSYHRSREAERSSSASSLWGNLSKPIMKGNAGKFRSEMTIEEVALVEKASLEQMRALGYEAMHTEEELECLVVESDSIRRFEEEDISIAKEVIDKMDDADRRARCRQSDWIEEIRARTIAASKVEIAV